MFGTEMVKDVLIIIALVYEFFHRSGYFSVRRPTSQYFGKAPDAAAYILISKKLLL